MNLFLTGAVNFCANTANAWQIVGWALLIFKIVIPILLIIFGILDLGKAVIASKDDEIKKSVKSLAFRAVAGIVIFLIPTLVGLVMTFVSDFKESGASSDYEVCKQCITRPNGEDCKTNANKAWGIDKPAGDEE